MVKENPVYSVIYWIRRARRALELLRGGEDLARASDPAMSIKLLSTAVVKMKCELHCIVQTGPK